MTTFLKRPPVQPGARQVFKMRELSNDTARVMREINESGRPALITLRGRFVAMITPLTDGELESKLISAALETGATEVRQFLEEEGASLSTQEVARELGIEVPEHGDRDPAE